MPLNIFHREVDRPLTEGPKMTISRQIVKIDGAMSLRGDVEN